MNRRGASSYPSLAREGEQACPDLNLLLINQAFQERLCVCAQGKMQRQWLEDVHRDLLWRVVGRGGMEGDEGGHSPEGLYGKPCQDSVVPPR